MIAGAFYLGEQQPVLEEMKRVFVSCIASFCQALVDVFSAHEGRSIHAEHLN